MRSLAAYCLKGHHIGTIEISRRNVSQLRHFLESESAQKKRFSSFCIECGSPVVERCANCKARFPPDAKYCDDCGKALSWTEHGLATAHAFTQEIEALSATEKTELDESFRNLTINSVDTPLAASRLRHAVDRLGSAVGTALLEIGKVLATGEAKKFLGI